MEYDCHFQPIQLLLKARGGGEGVGERLLKTGLQLKSQFGIEVKASDWKLETMSSNSGPLVHSQLGNFELVSFLQP